jgi:hypothetical protein
VEDDVLKGKFFVDKSWISWGIFLIEWGFVVDSDGGILGGLSDYASFICLFLFRALFEARINENVLRNTN